MVVTKILIVSTAAISSPPENYGGIELVVWLLADGLSKLGHKVALAAPQGSRPPNDNVEIIPTVDVKTQGYQENTAANIYGPRIKDFDLVSDHSHNKFASFYIKDNDLVGKVAYVPTVHNMGTIAYPIRKPSIVCLSQAHANQIEARHGYRCKYVYNGIDITKFKPVLKKKFKTDRYFICGRPNPEKNLLEAIDLCKKANVPCDVVAGRLSVEPVDYAVKVAQSCLFGSPWVYRGQLSHDEKNAIMARARASLITYGGRDSRSFYVEPFGLVAIESLLVGTPVIAYECGALGEIVRQGKDGFVVPLNDQDAIVNAMKEVGNLDPASIYEYAKIQWSHERMARDYEALFKKVLEGEKW